MKIIIDESKERIQMLSSYTGKTFIAPTGKDKEDAVCIYVRDNTNMSLKEAIESGCPVVVVAGNKDQTGEKIIKQAKTLGVPEECIIVKTDAGVKTCSGTNLGGAVGGGITVRQLVKVAEYAHAKELYPEMLIWKEQSMPQQKHQKQQEQKAPEETKSPKVQEEIKNDAPKKPAARSRESIPMDFDDFLKDYSLILGMVLDGDSPGLFKEVASQLNACHVEMTEKPTSFRVYADSLEEALTKGYGYANQKTALIPTGTKKALVELSLADFQPDMIDKVYQRAEKIIHVAGGNSISAVKDWLAFGYKLDIIATANEQAYQDISVPIATTADQIVKILKGGVS